jgi:hypothetical protein
MFRVRYIALLGWLVLLCGPPDALASGHQKPFGLSAFGGYQSYALSDVNDAIRDPSVFLAGASGTGNEISGGAGFGLGFRVWPSARASVAVDVSRLLGKSTGKGTYFGTAYSGEVSVPATSVAVTVGYYFLSTARAQFGLGGGGGYYTSTGQVSATGSGGSYSADLESSGFGFHGLGLVDVSLSPRLHADVGAGYRYAKTTRVEVNGFLQRNADGSKSQMDWSGFMSRIGITVYLVGR